MHLDGALFTDGNAMLNACKVQCAKAVDKPVILFVNGVTSRTFFDQMIKEVKKLDS